jgi:hypothetical protein
LTLNGGTYTFTQQPGTAFTYNSNGQFGVASQGNSADLAHDRLDVRLPGRAALGGAVRFRVVEGPVFAYTESYIVIVIQNVGRLP